MTRKKRICFSVFIGASRPRFSAGREAMLREITERHFPDGASIVHAKGRWFDPERKAFVSEEARQVLVCASSRKALAPWCAELASALDQKEFMIVQLGNAFSFRAGKKRSH